MTVFLAVPDTLVQVVTVAGADDDVVVIDESAARLEQLEHAVRDPRVWYLIGSPDVLPLPDRFVDGVFGADGSDVKRVLR